MYGQIKNNLSHDFENLFQWFQILLNPDKCYYMVSLGFFLAKALIFITKARDNPPEVFLGKVVQKICSSTGEHP